MIAFDRLQIPTQGEKIEAIDGELSVPDRPIVPFIEGDGVGPDIMRVAREVLDAGVERAYEGKKGLVWFEAYAGGKAQERYGELLPEDTLRAIDRFMVALKGPLTTPVGGYRSLNVALRQLLDLYACVRPVRYLEGVPSPVKHPERLDVVIYRENTEDVYAGIEWSPGSEGAERVISYLNENFGVNIRPDSGIGVKPISEGATKRLVRAAIKYAIGHRRESVTLVHKGNIMKFTEGAFRDWGYEVAEEEFGEQTITESEAEVRFDGKVPRGKLVIKDRIADSMFQWILTRPEEYDVIALPNLNGDYLSDACAAQIGGLGLAPGANIGDFTALFEPTHGTAPRYAGRDMVNPCSLILSGAMMLEYLGWQQAAELITGAVARTIKQGKMTYDLARLMERVSPVKTSEFGQAVIENMGT